jgi:cystathionine beta-lyase
MIMAFTQPGDKIIIQPPVYHPFFHSITNHKRKLVENPLLMVNGRLEMDFDHLESCIDDQTKLLIFCHPHNPGGTVWRKDELRRLGEICREKGVIIVSDEIHADLTLWGKKHIPLASLSQEISDITLTTMAPSKTFNLAALATSYVVASNKDLLKKYNEVLEQVHVGMGNLFGTVALEAAYNEGEEWLEQLLDYIEENMKFIKEFIELYLPKVKMIMPEATYLALLDFTDFNLSQKELNDKMVNQAKIGLNDGATFGKQGEGFMRINVACPRSILSEVLENMKEVFG